MDLEDHHDELKKTINSVSHIVKIPVPNPENLYDSHEAVLKFVKELTENIVELKAKHKREDFEEFNALKDKLIKLKRNILKLSVAVWVLSRQSLFFMCGLWYNYIISDSIGTGNFQGERGIYK